MTKPRYILTIGPEHIGRVSIKTDECPTCGTHTGPTIWVPDLMGRIMDIDIGKRIFRVGGVYQVENNEQRDARLASA